MTKQRKPSPRYIPPPRWPTRMSVLRSIEPGRHKDVLGKSAAVSVAAHRVFGRGRYRVAQVSEHMCRVWHLEEE